MPRPLPAQPRTRVEEIMRARGITQSELISRTGWSGGQLNRVVVGRTRLSPARAATLARLLDCPQGALYGAIGEPISPRQRAVQPSGAAERLAAVARVLGADWEGLLRFILAGDYSGLSRSLAQRLEQILAEEN